MPGAPSQSIRVVSESMAVYLSQSIRVSSESLAAVRVNLIADCLTMQTAAADKVCREKSRGQAARPTGKQPGRPGCGPARREAARPTGKRPGRPGCGPADREAAWPTRMQPDQPGSGPADREAARPVCRAALNRVDKGNARAATAARLFRASQPLESEAQALD